LQKLLGAINWVRPYLGVSTAQLQPLFALLKGDPNLCSPRTLTDDAHQTLAQVEQALTSKQVFRIVEGHPIILFIQLCRGHPAGILGQWCQQWPDPLHVL
ncbi:POK18 protein, partial [Hemiprocne comata]|nr:POK18 protein [Hemiprocne comata]